MDQDQQMQFKPLGHHECLKAFELYKDYLKPIVAAAIGWDEDYQKNSFNRRLQADGFHSVELDDKPVGMIYFKNGETSTHLHFLIIFSEAQRQGIGSLVIRRLQSLAVETGRPMTLSCFKNNKPAVNFYKKLGFYATAEDEFFYDFVCEFEH